MSHSPRCSSFSHLRDYSAIASSRVCSSGGQNLTALSAAAGQNLTAVGSSHSLTETVNLGTMTTAGLVGTLHSVTPPVNFISMLDSLFRPQQHIITDLTWSYQSIITEFRLQVNIFLRKCSSFGKIYSSAGGDSVEAG